MYKFLFQNIFCLDQHLDLRAAAGGGLRANRPAIQHSSLLECRRVTWGYISRNFRGSLCLNQKEYLHIQHHQAGNLTPRVRYFGSDFNQNCNVPTNSPNFRFH
jgi:hypothetical protein